MFFHGGSERERETVLQRERDGGAERERDLIRERDTVTHFMWDSKIMWHILNGQVLIVHTVKHLKNMTVHTLSSNII